MRPPPLVFPSRVVARNRNNCRPGVLGATGNPSFLVSSRAGPRNLLAPARQLAKTVVSRVLDFSRLNSPFASLGCTQCKNNGTYRISRSTLRANIWRFHSSRFLFLDRHLDGSLQRRLSRDLEARKRTNSRGRFAQLGIRFKR